MDEFFFGMAVCGLPLTAVFSVVAMALLGRRSTKDLKREVDSLSATAFGLSARVNTLEAHLEQLRAVVQALPAGATKAADAPVSGMTPPAELEMRPAEAPETVGVPIAAEERDAIQPAVVDPSVDPIEPVAPPKRAPSGNIAPTLAANLSHRANPDRGRASAPANPNAPRENDRFGAKTKTKTSDHRTGADHAPSHVVDPARPTDRETLGWEQWIGVRGMGAGAALVLMLAAVYLFQYSIVHGWLGPTLRVVIGLATGAAAVAVSEFKLRRNHVTLSNFVAGAGCAILFVSAWASCGLYDVLPTLAAGALMVATTGACVALSMHRPSIAIAVLGLVGGFATPALLSTGSDRPVPLFAYLLVLDLALLFVAQKRRWPALAMLSLLATSVYQVTWIVARMGPDRVLMGMGISVLFAILFAAVAPAVFARDKDDEASGSASALALFTRVAAIGIPFLFGLYFALDGRLELPLHTLAAYLGVLSLGVFAIGWWDAALRWTTLAAAAASVAILLGAVTSASFGTIAVPFMIAASALSVLFHLHAEAAQRLSRYTQSDRRDLALGSAIMTLGSLALLLLGTVMTRGVPMPAVLGTTALLAALGLRLARFIPELHLALGPALAVFLGAVHLARGGDAGFTPRSIYLGCSILMLSVFSLAGCFGDGKTKKLASVSAALFAAGFAFHFVLIPQNAVMPGLLFHGALIATTVIGLLSSGRIGMSLPAGLVAFAVWSAQAMGLFHQGGSQLSLAMLCGTAALVATSPLWLGRRARESAGFARLSALSLPLWFLPSLAHYREAFGMSAVGILPVAFGALCVLLAASSRVTVRDSRTRRVAFIWATVVAMGFLTVAIPLQLDKQWITIGWALQAAALLVLWRKVDHPGVKYFALALNAVVFIRLVLNPYVLGYYPPSGFPLVNWISYTYLIPIVTMVFGYSVLAPIEVARRRSFESFLPKVSLGNALVAAAIVAGFIFINLTIFDAFSVGRELTVTFERLPARDLILSLSWALYGISLLAIGMWKDSSALRWTSLALIVLTVGKVFLYDLGNLTDLYRVASLVGLAVSLFIISIAYQRFVFRRKENS